MRVLAIWRGEFHFRFGVKVEAKFLHAKVDVIRLADSGKIAGLDWMGGVCVGGQRGVGQQRAGSDQSQAGEVGAQVYERLLVSGR